MDRSLRWMWHEGEGDWRVLVRTASGIGGGWGFIYGGWGGGRARGKLVVWGECDTILDVVNLRFPGMSPSDRKTCGSAVSQPGAGPGLGVGVRSGTGEGRLEVGSI